MKRMAMKWIELIIVVNKIKDYAVNRTSGYVVNKLVVMLQKKLWLVY